MTYLDILNALSYESSKLPLGKMDDAKVVRLINELIQRGIYLDEFLDVIDRSYYRPDFIKAVTLSLARLGIKVPETPDNAVWILLNYNISRIVLGDGDPLYFLDNIIADVYWDYDFEKQTKKYLGDSHGIEHLIGLYWEYDLLCCLYLSESPPEPELEIYRKRAKEIAQDWIVKYAI